MPTVDDDGDDVPLTSLVAKPDPTKVAAERAKYMMDMINARDKRRAAEKAAEKAAGKAAVDAKAKAPKAPAKAKAFAKATDTPAKAYAKATDTPAKASEKATDTPMAPLPPKKRLRLRGKQAPVL